VGNPLLRRFVIWGAACGLVAALISGDILTGAAISVPFICAGLLWFRSTVPVFVFCVLYQWIFVVTGYLFLNVTGFYPGIAILGDIQLAVWYSLMGLLSVSLGIWFAVRNMPARSEREETDYEFGKVFWLVIGLFSVNWVFELSGSKLRLMAFDIAQILHHVLMVRYLSLYLLVLIIVRTREHFGLGILAFGFVLLPELTSSMTKFKDLFFLVLIVLLSQWRLSATSRGDRRINRSIASVVVSLTVLLLAVGLVWSAGLKHSWRTALLTGEVSGTPMQKMEAYGQHAAESIEQFDVERGATALASRLSSGVAYFSHAIRFVPAVTDHERGELSWRAVQHVIKPRFLFPEKPNLGGDSWLVRKYTGLNVSGDESSTSIGLGYMSEFYIDFGFPGMLVPILLYGMLLGGMYRFLYAFSPSNALFSAMVTGLFLLHFLSYEGNFVKLLGGVLQNFLILSVLLILFGQRVHTLLLRDVEMKTTHPSRKTVVNGSA